MKRRLRFWLAFPLVLAFGCASFGKFTPEAKTVLDGIWDAAKLLCLIANAEKTGASVDDIKDQCCRTQEEISPWFEAAKAGARAGAVKAGMSEPLTPENAVGELKSDPVLEQRK